MNSNYCCHFGRLRFQMIAGEKYRDVLSACLSYGLICEECKLDEINSIIEFLPHSSLSMKINKPWILEYYFHNDPETIIYVLQNTSSNKELARIVRNGYNFPTLDYKMGEWICDFSLVRRLVNKTSLSVIEDLKVCFSAWEKFLDDVYDWCEDWYYLQKN